MIAVLKETREAAGLSGRQVSVRLKRPINFCHRVESGERMLSYPEFIDYAAALDTDSEVLHRKIIARLKVA